MGSLRVGHNWATSLSRIGEGNGNTLQCSCLENPRDGEAWWAAVYGVAQSQTQLKQLRSSCSPKCPSWHINSEITLFKPVLVKPLVSEISSEVFPGARNLRSKSFSSILKLSWKIHYSSKGDIHSMSQRASFSKRAMQPLSYSTSNQMQTHRPQGFRWTFVFLAIPF